MATKRISGKRLKDLAIFYTVNVRPKQSSPVIFEFAEWVAEKIKSPTKPSKEHIRV